MNSKVWVSKAIDWLEDSLTPVPQELNEIDWKLDLSSNNKKLTHHLSAFANHPGGGYLAFGIDDKTGSVVGIATEKIGGIVERLASLSRDTVNPEAKLDHTVITYRGETVLIVHIRESSIKPVHLKTGSIEDTHIRTGGTTRIATRHEVAGLMLNSKAVRYEELHASKLLDRDEIYRLLIIRRF
jgi:ATP-dependent DNA helicase RecG